MKSRWLSIFSTVVLVASIAVCLVVVGAVSVLFVVDKVSPSTVLEPFPTRTPRPSFTATSTLPSLPTIVLKTITLVATSAVIASTDTPKPTDTATPTETLVPTPTQRPIPAPLPTNTPTPLPPTATLPVHQYTLEEKRFFNQCGPTQIYGGFTVQGVCIKVWADGWAGAVSNPSGVGRPAGECEVSLGSPKQVKYYVAVLESCNLDAPHVSDTIVVELEGMETCDLGGRQGARLFFKKNW